MSTSFRPATDADADLLIGMMRELYAHDGTAFNEASHRAALRHLLSDARFGSVWLIERNGNEIAGYLVLTLGFSLEFKGRDAFLDELYLRPEFRGRGLGQEAIAFAVAECERSGVCALHLEVERSNTSAQSAYRKAGFVDHDRYLLTKWLARAE